jgi:hypothetical protein
VANGVGDAMRVGIRTTVRLVLFPILYPTRLLILRRRKRTSRSSAAATPVDVEASGEQVRQRHGERRQVPALFSPSAARRASKVSRSGRVPDRERPDTASAPPPPGPAEPLIRHDPSTVSCRPAPTLKEVTDGTAAVDVAWTVGPLRFEGFGFAKTQGELSEDAFAGHLETGSVAVADGASTSWQAGEWALQLCDEWVSPDGAWGPGEHETRVGAVQRSFQDSGHTREAGPNPWFADEVARRGAFAAFLGVSFDISAGQSVAYRALSVGDVCVLRYRNAVLLASFPITSSDELNSQPELIGSSLGRRTSPAREFSGELESGDVLVLATDGVAGLLLGGTANGDLLRALTHGPVTDVAGALGTAHATGAMVDDDYTLVRVTL